MYSFNFLYLHIYGKVAHVCGYACTCAHAHRDQGATFGLCHLQKHHLAFEMWFLIVLEVARLAISDASLAGQQAPVSTAPALGFWASDSISSLFVWVLGREVRFANTLPIEPSP